ncbi:MAG TPA: alkaline phosphatase family protein, partial [Thermoanaerobaculia bacterium]|nr:alkaline phosphatase family protein [Thermoanaerobaculia bacterium]
MLKRSFVLLIVVSAFVAIPVAAQQRPDLVVVISIDQFRYDYMTRFAPYFSEGGFNRALKGGANFRRSLYPYATTYTGPGHAAIGTGYTPSRSGIIANTWFDRLTASPEYCVNDERSRGGFSPLNLASDSLGDRVGERYPGSKVIGIALKDRAAILMAGRKATAAYWFDPQAPGFTSSSYYAWNKSVVTEFNKTVTATLVAHPAWTQSDYIPAVDLGRITHDPPALRKYKTQREGLGVEFPHRIRSIDAFTYTPFGNDLVLDFAERVIDAEKLGTEDNAPDVIYLGLSSPDYLGHAFGPDSLEVADTVVRTDRQLADFFKWLDGKFGKRYSVAITSDHGVQSIPEVARDMGRDAGRVDMRNPNATVRTMGELAKERRALEKAVALKLGLKVGDETSTSDAFIVYFEEPAIYLNWMRIRELKLDGERVKRAVRDAAKQLKGVRTAFTNSELMATNKQAEDVEQAMRLSFRADRSG